MGHYVHGQRTCPHFSFLIQVSTAAVPPTRVVNNSASECESNSSPDRTMISVQPSTLVCVHHTHTSAQWACHSRWLKFMGDCKKV